MAVSNLGVLITAQDTATPQLKNLGSTLTQNKMAIRELAMGVSYLGMSFMGLGVALSRSNDESTKQIGNIIMLAGGIMTAVGSSFQFISAIAKIIDALKKLQLAQVLTQALSGPAGWATLGIGLAVAGAATAGVVGMQRSQDKAQTTINHVTVQGSVVTERQISNDVRKQTILTQNRNRTTGYR